MTRKLFATIELTLSLLSKMGEKIHFQNVKPSKKCTAMAKKVFEKELYLSSSFKSTTAGPIMDETVVPRESLRRRKDVLESQTTTFAQQNKSFWSVGNDHT